MKTGKIILFLSCLAFVACGEDRTHEYMELTAVDRWIETEMLQNYYWNDEIPETELNYFQEPETFFNSLLSSKDGTTSNRFSRIEDISVPQTPEATTRSTMQTGYGFQYNPYTYADPLTETSMQILRVLYTSENSPASDSGLKRGDLIFKVDTTTVTSSNRSTILETTNGFTLQTGSFNENNELVMETKVVSPPRQFENNPIHYSDILEHGGKKIGYLVYNSFTSGINEDDLNDVTYLTQLSSLSNEFKAAGVNEFILDLRYNLGGELNMPVPFICSMLVPPTQMGKQMGYIRFNENNRDLDTEFVFSTDHLLGGSNLDLTRVFVLVNSRFTASASEAVISFLKDQMEVIIIGSGTVGKNVGSFAIKSEEFTWVLHPITFQVYNSLDFTDYTSGFTPTHTYNELESALMLPFGNPDEPLLSIALQVIDGTYNPTETRLMRTTKQKPMDDWMKKKFKPRMFIRR